MVKKYVKLLFVMVCIAILAACSLTINTEKSESEAEKQSNSPGIRVEKDVEGNTEEDKNEKKEQELEETAVIENELKEQKPNETAVPKDELEEQDPDTREIVAQNDAFKIFAPAPNTEVKNQIVVQGLARVFEGTIQYEFEDGHFILDKGFTTASEGAPGWGEFEIIIELDEVSNYTGLIVLSEESAKDGSRVNELIIPVKVKD